MCVLLNCIYDVTLMLDRPAKMICYVLLIYMVHKNNLIRLTQKGSLLSIQLNKISEKSQNKME